MSRHRMIRNLNYEEEYEGYYDVYGRSVDDEYGVSPATAAEFMYDRNQKPDMSAYFPIDEDIAEEDGKHNPALDSSNDDAPLRTRQNSVDFLMPQLNRVDDARLKSCLDEIRNVLGESVSESVMVQAVLSHDFDLERALNYLLTGDKVSSSSSEPKPQRARRERRRDKDELRPDNPDLNVIPETTNLSSRAGLPSVVTSDHVESITDGIIRMSFSSGVVTHGFSKPDSACAAPNKQSEIQSVEEEGDLSSVDQLLTEEQGNGESATSIESSVQSKQQESQGTKKISRSKASGAEAEEDYQRQRGDSKLQLQLVVVGHVDAGKSTLMGHFLYKLGAVSQRTMHKYEQEAKKLGKQSFMYAWVLDETGEERSRGITMDIGQSTFETPERNVRLLDAPGHRDFIPAMITGTAQADVALLVVDSTTGEFETGFDAGGQTREHALLVRSLGVSQLGVAINKMDNVGWSENRFQDIVTKIGAFLKQAGFRESEVTYVPCSGLTGENLTEPPTVEELNRWYKGPTLLQLIDKFRPPERSVNKPLRLPVNDVFKAPTGGGFCVAGRVETGRITAGDKLLIMPQNETCVVKSVSIDDCPVTSAFAGDQLVVSLTAIDMTTVTVGCMLCDLAFPVPMATTIQARIVIFNIGVPITKGYPVVFHCQALTEPAVIKKLLSQIHKSTGDVIKKKPRCLVKNSQAEVEIEISRPICLELYRNCKELGRFMLRTGGSTIAAGLVTEILS